MTAKLGISPIGWSNDDLRYLGADISLKRCLTDAANAGYMGLELGHKFPREPGALREVLSPQGLQLVSGWHSLELLTRSVDEELAAMDAHLGLLQEMGCNVVVVAETTGTVHPHKDRPLAQRPTLSPDQWNRLTISLEELATKVSEKGLRLAYHHHVGTVVETLDEVKQLLERTGDSVGLVLDTGHSRWGGFLPELLLTLAPHRVVHVHLKDVRSNVAEEVDRENTSFLDAVLKGVFTVPGDGDIDYGPLFASLVANNYEGWLVVEAEQDPARAAPGAYASKGAACVRTLAAQHGLDLQTLPNAAENTL